MGNSIASLRDEVKKAQAASQKQVSEHEKQVAALTAEKNSLQKQLQDALASSSSAQAKVSSDLDNMKNKLEELEKSYKKQLLDAEEAKKKAIDSLLEKHRLELEAKTIAVQAAVDMAALKQAQLEEELEVLKTKHEKKMSELVDEQRAYNEQVVATHAAEVSELKATITTLEAQITSLSEMADGERGSLKTQLTAAENKTKSLQKELDAKKKESERVEGVCTSLKNQVESLRDELKATQKAFRDKMDASLAKVEADWQAKLDDNKPLEVTTELVAKGFGHVLINRRAYADQGEGLKNRLEGVGMREIMQNKDFFILEIAGGKG